MLLKPNLNALTGNTTDLCLLAVLLAWLNKDRGRQNVAVGENTNTGFYRNRISVITRLKVDELCLLPFRRQGLGLELLPSPI